MLYRYLTPQAAGVPAPPTPVSGWPTVAAYNGTQQQGLFGADVNNQFVYCVTGSVYQFTISNTINHKKASTVFCYELTPDGDLVSITPTGVVAANYDYTQTSWTRYLYVGAHPSTYTTLAVSRQSGTDTQSTSGTWSSTTAPTNGQILYKSGASYVAASAAAWQQKPVFNAAGTFVAGALTFSTGPTSNASFNLTGWNGTTATSSTNFTIPNSVYARDYIWIGDYLLVLAINSASGAQSEVFVLQRTGTTLSLVTQFPLVSGSDDPAQTIVTHFAADEANQRVFAACNKNASTGTNPVEVFTIVSNGGGSFTVTPVFASPHAQSSTDKFPVFPVSGNRLLTVYAAATSNADLFNVSPTGVTQTSFNSASYGSSIGVLVKAQPISGAVVTVQTTGANVRKIS